MSFTRNDANIRCPFFKRETAQALICEGFVKSAVLMTKFTSEQKKVAYIKKYCVRCTGGDCYLARTQFARYEENE